MQKKRTFILFGAFFALIAVISGAFGAHLLESRLEALGSSATWDTAVSYQMWHALALLILAKAAPLGWGRSLCLVSFCLGIVLFSGSLYWLALDGPRWLGPITPLGGLLLIIGWVTLIISAFKMRNE
jgi:uncharacterized membrane protein YgdD (TMEM256/DUF423 family)